MTSTLSYPWVAPSRDLSGVAAVVGVGDTDYGFDYTTARGRAAPPEHDIAGRLALTAFERALADSGLRRSDVDGILSAFYGGSDPAAVADMLGIRVRHAIRPRWQIIAGSLPQAVEALANRQCDTIALVYSAPLRSRGETFGGDGVERGPASYFYFHPWGWSSQAAHWALMARYYQSKYGVSEVDLGAVASGLREHATRNENAIFRQPMTIDDYLASRYVVAPMRLFDICPVTDGAVCLILQRTETARDLRHTPVLVSGWGYSEVHDDKFERMVVEGLSSLYQDAGRQAFEMAGLGVGDVDHFEGYDASSIHLVLQLEGYGLVPAGEGVFRWGKGEMALDGRLPVNTEGGMLSEAYTHGWGHVAEAVRQLRHGRGDRQVDGVNVSFASMATTQEAFPVILRRDA